MLQQQDIYIKFIESVKAELLKIEDMDLSAFKLDEIKEAIENVELIVPVIGAFSAGKSSLINSFLGSNHLSVNVTPETALATELRHSQNEYIELIKEDDSIEKLDINQIENIKNKAKESKFARFYLNNPILKEIQPLVLVDMPGFESPLEGHNKAIMQYLQRGVYFIALQSIEDGNITKSMLRELESIVNFDRDFTFFLSKVNLKSESSREKISILMQEQLNDYLGLDKKVELLDDKGGENLKLVLKSIDPQNLIKNLFEGILQDKFSDIKQNINTKIKALSVNDDEINQAIKNLEDELIKLQNEQKSMQEKVEERYSSKGVESIINKISSNIHSHIDEIASAYLLGQENGERTLSEITNNAISLSVRESLKTIQENITENLATSLANINTTMSNFALVKDWINDESEEMKKAAAQLGATILEEASIIVATKGPYGIIAAAIMQFIAKILPSLFEKSKEEKKREQLESIKEQILTSIIPQIKTNLKAELPSKFNAEVSKIIEQIATSFKDKIEQISNTLKQSIEEKERKQNDLAKVIASYKEVLERLNKLANENLF